MSRPDWEARRGPPEIPGRAGRAGLEHLRTAHQGQNCERAGHALQNLLQRHDQCEYSFLGAQNRGSNRFGVMTHSGVFFGLKILMPFPLQYLVFI